jgi:transposase-like protein
MNATVKNSKMARRDDAEFKRQTVKLMIHSGKTQRQVARELDVSDVDDLTVAARCSDR